MTDSPAQTLAATIDDGLGVCLALHGQRDDCPSCVAWAECRSALASLVALADGAAQLEAELTVAYAELEKERLTPPEEAKAEWHQWHLDQTEARRQRAVAAEERVGTLEAERDEALRLVNGYRQADKTISRAEAAEAEVARLREALRRGCDETDYCYVCDCHPSHGHAKDCALAAPTKEEGT